MKRGGAWERYEDDRLYCVACKVQPEYFHEVMEEHVNRVTPEGALLEPESESLHVTEYQCPECKSQALWGQELNR
jgi:hypothetical protein